MHSIAAHDERRLGEVDRYEHVAASPNTFSISKRKIILILQLEMKFIYALSYAL
jgi:hypothetical protein